MCVISVKVKLHSSGTQTILDKAMVTRIQENGSKKLYREREESTDTLREDRERARAT